MRHPTILLASLLLVLALAGCGGGGGSGGDGLEDDGGAVPAYATGPLRAEVLFPPDGSLGRCGQITVTGTAGGTGIARVRVNGVEATGFNEFGGWFVKIPLDCDQNILRVDVEDEDGAVLVNADRVAVSAVEEFLFGMSDLIYENDADVVTVFDHRLNDVVEVSLVRGTRRRLHIDPEYLGGRMMFGCRSSSIWFQSGYSIIKVPLYDASPETLTLDDGGGSSPLTIRAIAPDCQNDRMFALGDRYEVYAFDLVDGGRTVLSSFYTIGTGPRPGADGIAYDRDANRLFTVDGTDVIEISLATGDRTLLSTNVTRNGPFLEDIRTLNWYRSGGRLIAYGGDNDATAGPDVGIVWSIDPATGTRALVSGPTRGTGPILPYLSSGVGTFLDDGADRLLVLDRPTDRILAVDLDTGDRTVVLDHSVGTGPALRNTRDMVTDVVRGRAILSDVSLDALIAVDVSTGARTEISSPTRGTGPGFRGARGFLEDFANNRLFVTDPFEAFVVAVDLTTGNRTIISDNSRGSGPLFQSPVGISRGPVPSSIYVIDDSLGHPSWSGTLLEIDLASGDRRVLSDATVPSGHLWERISGVDYDAARNRFIVSDIDKERILSVDDGTGFRSLVSENGAAGIGLGIGRVQNTFVDTGRDRALVSDRSRQGVTSIDLATGDRLVIYDATIGSGPSTPFPYAAAPHTTSGQILVVDSIGGLFLVDEASGDRVLISK